MVTREQIGLAIWQGRHGLAAALLMGIAMWGDVITSCSADLDRRMTERSLAEQARAVAMDACVADPGCVDVRQRVWEEEKALREVRAMGGLEQVQRAAIRECVDDPGCNDIWERVAKAEDEYRAGEARRKSGGEVWRKIGDGREDWSWK